LKIRSIVVGLRKALSVIESFSDLALALPSRLPTPVERLVVANERSFN
jgi:hypothetical protein